MTAHELKRKFPNASASFLAQNSGAAAVMERPARDAALEDCEDARPIQGRVLIRFTSRRRRLIDPDNLCVKATLDCLRYSGILADDTSEHISLETRQEKVGKGEQEETVIEIFQL